MIERANQKRSASVIRAITYRGKTIRSDDFDPSEFAKRIVSERASRPSLSERTAAMERKFARSR